MALTAVDEGTLTSTTGEQTFGSAITTPGVYVLSVNLKNMADGDTFTLRAYVKMLTGDSVTALAYSATFSNKQGDGADAGSSAKGDVVAISIPVPSAYEVEFTLIKEAGTNRDFPWRIDSL